MKAAQEIDMTFLNPSVLLNMGAADAVKTAAGNTQSQESQTSASDEFAQALRKQMQQADKPAPAANEAKQKPQAKEARHAAVQSREQAKANAAGADEKSSLPEDANQAGQLHRSTDTPEADETPQARRKRLLAEVETTDTAAAGLAPWMQSMIAMRPVTGQGLAKGKAVSADGADKPLQGDALLVKTEAVAGDTAEKTHGVQRPLALAVTEDDSTGQMADVGQEMTDIPDSAMADPDQHGSFTETLGIAKAVAAATQQMAGSDKTASALMQMETVAGAADPAQPLALPAAQALPNSSWLSAAGIPQNASVMMSQIATPFGNERWQAAMNQHVLNMAGSGDDVASLTLSPPDLGPIQVVLKVDNQSVNTSFISDNPLVRQALEDGMQDLRERMQSQGLALGQTFIGNGEQAQQHFGQASADGGDRTFNQSAQRDAGTGTDAAIPATAVRTTAIRGLVDTFV